jgi:hypothetical protein
MQVLGIDLDQVTATLGAAQQAFKTVDGAVQLAVGVRELFGGKQDDATLAQAQLRVAELLQQLVAARVAQLAILDQLEQLKRAASEAERLHRDLSQYELWRAPGGAVVLAARDSRDDNGHHHYACYNCAQDGKKRILQPYENSTTTLQCQSCGQRFRLGPSGGGQGGLNTGWDLV